jgi:hypothetical protein
MYLIFVNHARGWHAGDLEEALTGYFHALGGEVPSCEVRLTFPSNSSTVEPPLSRAATNPDWLLGNEISSHSIWPATAEFLGVRSTIVGMLEGSFSAVRFQPISLDIAATFFFRA